MTVGRFINTSTILQQVKIGVTLVHPNTSTTANRRAVKITCTEGKAQSISIYHNGGTGNLILAIYSNVTDAPGSRLAISLSTPINATAGWQKLNLTSLLPVTEGQIVWLAWVFQTNPGIRYNASATQRAESTSLWAGGMPEEFGAVGWAAYEYSSYITILTTI